MASPHILYIEDNDENRVLVRKVLEREGFQVSEAKDGVQGIAQAQALHPDLILMDINLPRLSGNEAATRIKALPELSKVPIVALSAHVFEADKKRSLAAGCDGYIEKPIDVAHFPDQVRRYLAGHRERLAEGGEEPAYLRQYSQELVERLDHELDALREAHERLKEMDQLKDEILRNLSHELRTPLTPVKGYLEMLENESLGPLSEKQKKAVAAMKKNVERLRELIENLLEFAGLEAQKIPFHYTSWKLESLLGEVIELHRAAIRAKRLEVSLDTGDVPLDIVADRTRVREVVDHLLGNAVKFSHEEGTVRVIARRIEGGDLSKFADEETLMGLTGEKDYALLTVQDAGVGLPVEIATHIFDGFRQADASVTRHFGGIGLGLPIAQKIVQSHGGRIWHQPSPKGGATFQVLLPLVPG